MNKEFVEREWVVLARDASEKLEGLTYGKKDEVKRLIAKELNVKESTLSRTLYIYNAIKKIERFDPEFVNILRSITFSAAELLEKLHRLDMLEAKTAAIKVYVGKLTVRQLRSMISDKERPTRLLDNTRNFMIDNVAKKHFRQDRWLMLNALPKIQPVKKDYWLSAAGVEFVAGPTKSGDRALALMTMHFGADVSERHIRRSIVSRVLKSLGLVQLGWHIQIYLPSIFEKLDFMKDITTKIEQIENMELIFV